MNLTCAVQRVSRAFAFVIALLATAPALAQDIAVVSLTNSTGQSATDLHVTFTGAGGSLSVDPFTVFAPGCPLPSVAVVGDSVDIDWGVPCVPNGATVVLIAQTPNGPLGYGSGFWTSAGVNIGLVISGPPTMYAAARSTTRDLITVDTSTGAADSVIGTFTTAFGPVAGLDCDAAGVLWGGTGGLTGNLVTIDTTTAVETLVGNHGLAIGSISALEWVGSTLYAIHANIADSTLVTLDPLTGAATVIGSTGFPTIGGLAFDPFWGVMYGVEGGGGGGQLVAIDLLTGAATAIGPTGFSVISALEFDTSTGTLYGGLGTGDALGGGIIRIDQITGAATLVGSTGYTNVSGLAFCGGGVQLASLSSFFNGGTFPNGLQWKLRMRRWYKPINPIKGPWFNIPGPCWARWCCFAGLECYFRIEAYAYKTGIGRLFGARGCVPITAWTKFRILPAGWMKSFQTWEPDEVEPGDIGPPPDIPDPIKRIIIIPRAHGRAHVVRNSNDGGTSFNVGSDFHAAFLNASSALDVTVEGDGTPPLPILPFELALQERAPGFCVAAAELQPLIDEIMAVLNDEPDPIVASVLESIEQMQQALQAMCGVLATGLAVDHEPFEQMADACNQLASLFNPAVPPFDWWPELRLGNAGVHLFALAASFSQAAAIIQQNMYDGINDLPQRDAFLFEIINTFPAEFQQLADAMAAHACVQLAFDPALDPGWPMAVRGSALVTVWNRNDLDGDPLLDSDAVIGRDGRVYIPRMGPAGADVDSETPLRVLIKAPAHLSIVVDMPPGDGVILSAPAIAGDVNGDDCVDGDDVAQVIADMAVYGAPAPAIPPTDLNGDGVVDEIDLAIVEAAVGQCGDTPDDCNGNGVPDAVDIDNGDAVDCDGNGIPDECDIAAGFLTDANGNGTPDECEPCPGDTNGDGLVNLGDLLNVISNWGSITTGPVDLDGSGIVDLADLLAVISNWGATCP